MPEKPIKPKSLALRTAQASSALSHLKSKWLKGEAERASKTTRLALQDRRVKLAEQSVLIQNISAKLSDPDIPDGEKTKLSNLANISGMVGYLEGLGLIVDSLTEVEPCRIQKKDGEIVPGKRRISVAENISEVHDMLIDVIKLLDVLVEMQHDMVSAQIGFGKDEHGVPLKKTPYADPSEDEPVREAAPIKEGEGDAVSVAEEEARIAAAGAK